jgi:hypothetical protein
MMRGWWDDDGEVFEFYLVLEVDEVERREAGGI